MLKYHDSNHNKRTMKEKKIQKREERKNKTAKNPHNNRHYVHKYDSKDAYQLFFSLSSKQKKVHHECIL